MERLALCVVLLAALLLPLGGCEQTLFPDDMARSPYDRYQRLRGRAAPATTTNSYGGEVPSLRNRLKPLGEP